MRPLRFVSSLALALLLSETTAYSPASLSRASSLYAVHNTPAISPLMVVRKTKPSNKSREKAKAVAKAAKTVTETKNAAKSIDLEIESAPLPASTSAPAEHVRVKDDFYEGAEDLRETFDEHFDEPRQAHAMRFVWDYWFVPGQYTLHRTQAANYFDAPAFDALTEALTAYGKRELGLRSISPPWLSFYVDGCEQSLHADVPQGPFAYVLSLTRWDSRAFTGGETNIVQPQILDFWRGFDSSTGLEYNDLFTSVEPLFNRLTVFDARLPHGVRRVEGERDPRGARLVLHGWFTDPSPFYEGALSEEAVRARSTYHHPLHTHMQHISPFLQENAAPNDDSIG